MARRIKAKLIMELREQGLSRRKISSTRHMSMESVCKVFDIAAERGIAWEQVKGMGEDEAYRLFYPDRHVRESVFEEPDWGYVHKEMAKVGVNLRLLHEEYKSENNQVAPAHAGDDALEVESQRIVLRLLRKPYDAQPRPPRSAPKRPCICSRGPWRIREDWPRRAGHP